MFLAVVILRVLCVGDSLTEGYWEDLSKVESFVVSVSASGGARSKVITSRLTSKMNEGERPTDVVWFGGVNDCAGARYPKVAAERVLIQMKKAVALSKKHGFRLFLVEHYPWDRTLNGRPWMCSEMVNDWIEELAGKNNGVYLVETWELGDADKRLLREYDHGDGLHLNAKGYRWLAGRIAETILKISTK